MKNNSRIRSARRTLSISLLLCALSVVFIEVAHAAPSLKNFDQCANQNNTLGPCVWIGSSLNSGLTAPPANARYVEGMSVPQRLWINNLNNATSHSIGWTLSWNKSVGSHSYDFMTSYAQAVQSALKLGNYNLTLNPCSNLNNADTTTCNNLLGGPNVLAVDVPNDPFISAICTLPCTDPSAQARINSYEAYYGNRTIQVSADQPFIATLSLLHSGPDSGTSSDVSYTLLITSQGGTPVNQVIIQFAAHIAVGDAPGDPAAPGTNWGNGTGASGISGAPYHVNNPCVDGSGCTGGGADNQLQVNAPLPPSSMVTRISNPARVTGLPVTDTLTMTIASGTIMSGTTKFYICGPTTAPSPCLPQYITKTLVSSQNISTTSTGAIIAASSPFTVSAAGNWCFLVQWVSQNFNSQSNEAFATTNECVNASGPTAVALSSMKASNHGAGSVVLNWTTGSQVNTAGFNLYRAENSDGPYARINSQLVPASSNGVTGNTYQYEDATTVPGKTYYYQLEDVELNGKSTRHEPIALSAPEMSANNLEVAFIVGIIVGTVAAVASGLFIALKTRSRFS